MSRRTPTGALLEWVLATALPLPFEGVTPFLIDWGNSDHPAADRALPQATLLEFRGTHPDTVGVQKVLVALNVMLPVTAGEPELRATLQTPRGAFQFG